MSRKPAIFKCFCLLIGGSLWASFTSLRYVISSTIKITCHTSHCPWAFFHVCNYSAFCLLFLRVFGGESALLLLNVFFSCSVILVLVHCAGPFQSLVIVLSKCSYIISINSGREWWCSLYQSIFFFLYSVEARKSTGEYSGKWLAFEMGVKVGQFFTRAGGVPLRFAEGVIPQFS